MGWERAKNCFPVPNELLQLNLPAGAVAVYIYLLCHADHRTNRCHPSEATMAKVLHLSRNTVAKHVRLLEEYELIITGRTQVQMKNGIRKKRKPAVYHRPYVRCLGAALPAANGRAGASASAAEAGGTGPRSPVFAPVSRCAASFGVGQRPCPGEGFRASFGRIFVDFPGSAEDEGRGRRKISKPGRELRFFCWRDHLSGTVQIRTVGRERSAATISVSPFRLAIPPKMRHNSPWKECALYAA